jgi:hypothetical protein
MLANGHPPAVRFGTSNLYADRALISSTSLLCIDFDNPDPYAIVGANLLVWQR